MLLPGATCIEALRALDAYLASKDRHALVVLDNAHRVAASDLRVLIDATRHLRFVLLALAFGLRPRGRDSAFP